MSEVNRGELVPLGGGDTIPLIRDHLTFGRRDADICLDFPNVSVKHCEMTYQNGHWVLADLGSTNGVKVNGVRVTKKALAPEDVISIAKRQFKIKYTPVGAAAMQELLDEADDIMSQPLLEKAGLVHAPRSTKSAKPVPQDPDAE